MMPTVSLFCGVVASAIIAAADVPVGTLMIGTDYKTVQREDASGNTLAVSGMPIRMPGSGPFGGPCIKFRTKSAIIDRTLGVGAMDFGTGNWTAECWIRADSDPGVACTFFGNWSNNSNYRSWRIAYNGTNAIIFNLRTDIATTTRTVTGTITPSTFFNGTWHHIAVQRRGTICEMYIDGVSVGTPYSIGSNGVQNTNIYYYPMYGAYGITNAPTEVFVDGYMDELRITKGLARYSSTFTPPTSGFGDNSTDDPNYAYVTFLVKHNNTTEWGYVTKGDHSIPSSITSVTNTSTHDGHIIDDGIRGSVLGGVAEALSYTISDTTLDPGASDFTIDYFFSRHNGTITNGTVSYAVYDSSSNVILGFTRSTSNGMTVSIKIGSTTHTCVLASVTLTTIEKLAIVRDGSSLRFYRNGTLIQTTSVSGSMPSVSGGTFRLLDGKACLLTQGFRWIKGVARYSGSTITHPARADLVAL